MAGHRCLLQMRYNIPCNNGETEPYHTQKSKRSFKLCIYERAPRTRTATILRPYEGYLPCWHIIQRRILSIIKETFCLVAGHDEFLDRGIRKKKKQETMLSHQRTRKTYVAQHHARCEINSKISLTYRNFQVVKQQR